MVTDKIAQISALREKAAKLEAEVAAERSKALAALPSQYGFSDAKTFATAVLAASGGSSPRGRRAGRPAKASKPAKRSGRKPRAKVTDDTRAEVKKLVQAGKTGAEVAAALNISLPTVQNIKKALGLVGKRKK